MKIAFVTQPWDFVTPEGGGRSSIPILTYQLARRLAGEHEVTIFSRLHGDQAPQSVDGYGIHYRPIRVNQRDEWLLLPRKALSRLSPSYGARHPGFSSGLYRLSYLVGLGRALREQQFDVVHIHNFSQYVPWVRLFSPRSKIVLHMHCEWLVQLDKATIGRRLAHADLVLSCSDYVTAKTRARFPEYAGRCHTLHNGVDVGAYYSSNQETSDKSGQSSVEETVLFVGRLSPEKGVHVLLDAFARVLETHPQAHLDIVGSPGAAAKDFVVSVSDDPHVEALAPFFTNGSYYPHLQARQNRDVMARVTFRGHMPYEEVLQHLRDATVFVFPSVWEEPFGMPVVEAMASAVPVVASRSGGITEIVEDGQTGLLVERANPEALADAIGCLLENPVLRKEMGRAGQKRAVENYSWERISESLSRYYEFLMERVTDER